MHSISNSNPEQRSSDHRKLEDDRPQKLSTYPINLRMQYSHNPHRSNPERTNRDQEQFTAAAAGAEHSTHPIDPSHQFSQQQVNLRIAAEIEM
ncbi:hypothetical protein R1flu_014040 [Riccia fluitans]|uniref:Uncharacterized protein n=1 Tax=Riccia fluitans TaxID=41844 RepID=A0ABD1YG26_9MARC